MKLRLNALEITLIALAVAFGIAPILLTIFYYDIYPVFHAVDVFLWLFFLLETGLFIFALWRLLYTMNSDRFRTTLLIPAAVAVICGVLSFICIDPIDVSVNQRDFEQNKSEYTLAVEYLDTQPFSKEMELSESFHSLSVDGKVLAYSCVDGKYTCYLFVKLNHENRYEGVLYVAGSSPVLYYDITDQYLSYAYEELAVNYIRVVLYK